MKPKLIKLTREYELKFGEMIDEWKIDQEMSNTNTSPWSAFRSGCHDFDYYLHSLEIKSKTENEIPDSVFFFSNEERDRLLGAVNIRHYLDESLLKGVGHIGDGIRPSKRRNCLLYTSLNPRD